MPETARQNGHIYLVAQPITAPRDVARDLIYGNDMQEVWEIVSSAESTLSQELRNAYPELHNAADYKVRAQGVALCTYAATGPGRTVLADDLDVPHISTLEDGLLDVELRFDGGLRVTIGRMTMSRDSMTWAMDGTVVAFTRRLVTQAAAFGEKCGYAGSWLFGIHCNELRGTQSVLYYRSFGAGRGPCYDAEDYREVTTASHVQMRQEPEAVTERLVGRLLHGLGTRNRFSRYLTG